MHESPGLRRPLLALVLVVAGALAGGCLPSSVSPTPTPGPVTPSPSASPSPTTTATPATPTPTPGPASIVHTVVAGDSLVSLGRRYETTGRSIAYWNRAAYPSLDPESPDYDPNRIEIGWRLTIYPGEVYEPGTDQTPTPAPTPQGTLVIPPGPTPAASGSAVVVSNGARGGNAVALTFDLGGRVEPAVDIVTWLIANDVAATIFPTGSTLSETAAGREIAALVASRPDLLTMGNHSWDHPDFTTLSAAAIRDQLERTDAAVTSAIGIRSTPLFRPPYGAHDADARAAVGAAGWPYLVMWDIDTIDWRPVSDGGPTADDIRTKVLSRAEGGSIVLMHLGGFNTLDALPGIVDGLRARGLEPVTLHRLLGLQPGG
jgi:peptidoglycan/xylan/chitin deacetylase (PgdA/CDA1 family)